MKICLIQLLKIKKSIKRANELRSKVKINTFHSNGQEIKSVDGKNTFVSFEDYDLMVNEFNKVLKAVFNIKGQL
jgi:hypothetical protein